MANQKAEILREFDTLISELKALIRDIPDYSNDRYVSDITEYISPENQEKFVDLRTRCVVLLYKINSNDAKLKQAIDFIRDANVLLWNIREALEKMQSLRSEFASDLLTSHPRLLSQDVPEGKQEVHQLTRRVKLFLPFVISVCIAAGAYFVLDNSSLTFLANHKQRIPLQLFAGLMVFLFALGMFRPKWRTLCWGAGLLAVVIGAIQIMGE